MDTNEFREDLLERTKIEAATSGEGSSAAFAGIISQYLIDAEVLPDYQPAFYTGLSKSRKRYRVDGYAFDEIDNTMNLIIAEYCGNEERTIAKNGILEVIKKLEQFIHQVYFEALQQTIEMSTPCADLVEFLIDNKDRIRKFRLLVFTDSFLSESIKEIDIREVNGIPIECQVWDIDRVFRVCSSELGRQKIIIDFKQYANDGIPCLEASKNASSQYNSYLCIIPGKVLADIYDNYGSQLLEGNVRSFLSTKVSVNKKIRETIIRYPSMFFAYNNGISATAINVRIEENQKGRFIVNAEDFQIINGGQTTASLSNTRYKDKADIGEIYVQMKLTQIDESDPDRSTELIRNISRSSNSQNKVSDVDFFATHPFHIRMEQFSRRIFAPAEEGVQYETKWFYERARGQYLQAQMRLTASKKKQFTMQNPRNKVITKTDFAKVRNTWSGYPHIVSRGAQTNFLKFAELIDESWSENDLQFNERYFTETAALMLVFRKLETSIPKQEWYEQGYRANIVTYSIAMLRHLISRRFAGFDLDLQSIWNKQSVPIEISSTLDGISEAVYRRITASDRQTVNVTQWCKREACWKSIQELEIALPTSLNNLLIDRSSKISAEKEARKDQKVISGAENQIKVLEYNPEQWRKLFMFGQERKMLSPEESDALRIACMMPNKLPNPYQCTRLLMLLDRAQNEGFTL